MITLTLGRRFKTPYAGYVALPRLWDTLRKSMLRKWGTWRYLAFVEGQENRGGMPHFHILSNRLPSAANGKRGVPTKHTTHDWAVRLGWGFEIDVTQVTGRTAAEYISKYASKATGAVPKGFRRVRVNRSWARGLGNSTGRLIVPARDEDIAHFVARVCDETGLSAELVYQKWTDGQTEVYNSQVM